MQVFNSILLLQKHLLSYNKNNSIGFIPTMGALHQGHVSLFQKAKKENTIIVVSIFVNPTQFNKKEDLENYPITMDADLSLLETIGCDVVFTPSVTEIYKQKITSTRFDFGGIEHQMEGKFRNGHFNGVATIVKRLFDIVKPTKAYFGKKDFQQLQIIKKLVAIEQLPLEIIGCKIYRERDGLAMSSRNARLTKKQREAAPFIYNILKKIPKKFQKNSTKKVVKWVEKKFKKHALLELEYFEIAKKNTLKKVKKKDSKNNCRAFIAVFAGKIRLIDNMSL